MKHEAFFDSIGESSVRLKVASLPPDNEVAIEGKAWLEAKRVSRDEETLSIAKEANRLASEANEIARNASLAATAAAAAASEANTIARSNRIIAIAAIIIAPLGAIAQIIWR